jgi:hypothetical protein
MRLAHTRRNFSLLVGVAILNTIIWRVEVELRGWEGLKWISYYHLAIPIGVGFFATWLALCSNLPSLKKRLSLTGLFLLAFVPLYEVLKISAALYFITGPSAMWLLPFPIISFSIFLIYPGLLMFFWMLAKKFGLHLDRRTCLTSAGFYLGAWPLAMILGPLTGVPGDAIHTIKSGNLFLFMTIGVGIPFLASYKNASLKN